MTKQRLKDDIDLTLNYSFTDLYRSGIQWFNVNFEFVNDWRIDFGSSIEILNVNGFSSPEALKHHFNNLYKKDYPSFISSLHKTRKDLWTKQVEKILREVSFFKELVVSEFPYEGRNRHKFRKWRLTESKELYDHETLESEKNCSNPSEQFISPVVDSLRSKFGVTGCAKLLEKETLITDEMILAYAEQYALAFLESMNQFIRQLEQTMNDLELNTYKFKHIISPLKSYKYIHYSLDKNSIGYFKMNELWEELKQEPKFISENTSFANFHRIFSGMEVKEPIEWINPNINTLHYFIKRLNKSGVIENTKNKHFEIACRCFVDPNGKRYDQAKLKGQKKPANAYLFDNLIDLLKLPVS